MTDEEANLKELYFSDLDRELDALRESVMKSTETFKKDCIEVMNFYKTVPYAVGVGYSTKEVLDNIKEGQGMTDRERLTELLCNSRLCEHTFEEQYSKNTIYKIADYLLSNGVIVLPCKVGDKLFRVVKLLNGESFVVEGIALEYAETFENGKTNKRIYFWANGEEFTRRHYSLWLEISAFGKTVFRTIEEAEKAKLKECKKNG